MHPYERYSSGPSNGRQQNDSSYSDVSPEPTLRYRGHQKITGRQPRNRTRVDHSPSSRALSANSEGESGGNSSISPRPRPGRRNRRPLMKIIDWRGQICRFLNIELESTDEFVLESLYDASEKLEEAERLAAEKLEPQDLTPEYQEIHRVRCASDRDRHTYLYLEEPFVVNSGPRNAHLRGSKAIHNFELHLERNKSISFIAYKDYRCCDASPSAQRMSGNPEPSALMIGESVSIISPDLAAALNDIAKKALARIPHPNFLDIGNEFSSPYLWWFCGRKKILEAERAIDMHYQKHTSVFKTYLHNRLGATWSTVDSLLSKGKISSQYIEYLFVPNTIVLKPNNKTIGLHRAYLANSWLNITRKDWAQTSGRARPNGRIGFVNGISWAFNGTFQKTASELSIDWLPSMTDPFNISDLMIYPIKFAENGLKNTLRARGEMFWKCRWRNYVSYSEDSTSGIQRTSDSRFMIDYATYRQMHPSESKNQYISSDDDLNPDLMSQEDPPLNDDFWLCLPTTIPGFNMNKKEWTNLDVSRITPVQWNTEAFESLVVDKETKELINALVTNQIDAEKGTDLMSGKGNGLFILLHGGPGTGKTLTAESVAEVAKKPLYRVTCGDIGTKAEDYLEVVLLLGKTWGCVVLLDEADVFLEQRKISDLQRNALVSVFLRVLEYYDGILILTSNRVGLFDEAFKSRIQLTLRYKKLEKPQRKQIWDNFISRLEEFESSPQTHGPQRKPSMHSGVDLGIDSEVRQKLSDLADAELNGREIRNAISTARQLAMFRKEKMGYEHLLVVINEAKKFTGYLEELSGGLTSDDMMKAEWTR
ncbi:hypothetical protein V492_07707 [Pseudogymnoascus sp. VKM F-4246]|nr:hypothetical protein V492_07707 [Pseudogymnoascus sp. VKM F-4246]